MRSRAPGLESVREIIEAAFAARASGGAAGAVTVAAAAPGRSTGESERVAERATSVVVGEVLDTHHPHLPGRVFVRWLDERGDLLDRWVQRERHLALRQGDHVLLTLPTGWGEWIVTGALGRPAAPRALAADDMRTLQLEPGEALRVSCHDGRVLLTLRQAEDGPVLQLGEGDVELSAERTLRLRADAIELTSASGGIDVRTDGDAVLRARTIRLN